MKKVKNQHKKPPEEQKKKDLSFREIEELMGIRRPRYEKRGGVIKQRGGK